MPHKCSSAHQPLNQYGKLATRKATDYQYYLIDTHLRVRVGLASNRKGATCLYPSKHQLQVALNH
eukprot:5401152-Amphidinium_carterae.1